MGVAALAMAELPSAEPARAVALEGWKRDRRLPWRWPGFCVNETADERVSRLRYLARFVPIDVTAEWQSKAYAHPETREELRAVVADLLDVTHRAVLRYLPLPTQPPLVYLHESAEALRAHSCAGRAALAYYDGAIHLATPPEIGPELTRADLLRQGLMTSLGHEYVHHVLVSNGIGRPVWLQEALAMFFAQEFPQANWRARPIALDDMVEYLPHDATPEFETTFYTQASAMLELLRKLCGSSEGCYNVDLVLALQKGQASPETLFEWAISQRAREGTSVTPLSIWNDYVAHEMRSPLLLSARRASASTP
jgi:hypothetical protein